MVVSKKVSYRLNGCHVNKCCYIFAPRQTSSICQIYWRSDKVDRSKTMSVFWAGTLSILVKKERRFLRKVEAIHWQMKGDSPAE